MKKISLLSLIFMLSFYNYSSTVGPRFVFQEDIPTLSLNYAIGLLAIKSCDSQNHLEIKTNAVIDGIYNGYLATRSFRDILENFKATLAPNSPAIDKTVNTILGLFNANLLVDHIKFCYQNLKFFNKSKQRAHFNKMIKLNMATEKIKQLVWLTFNTAFPYLCFATKKMYRDKVDFKDALYEDDSITSSLVILAASQLAHASENKRRHTLGKAVKKESLRRIKQSS